MEEGSAIASATDKQLYAPPTDPVLVDVPEFDFLMIDGQGDPNTSPDYRTAVSALYAVNYPVVITLKRAGRSDLKVRPLEGLWWLAEGRYDGFDPRTSDRSGWRWTIMIRQPDDVPDDVRDAALAKAGQKLGVETLVRLRLEPFHEGLSAQLLHRGPYSDEQPNLVRLHEFIESLNLEPRGKHHESYLSDPNRVAPERMRTVLRQPVA